MFGRLVADDEEGAAAADDAAGLAQLADAGPDLCVMDVVRGAGETMRMADKLQTVEWGAGRRADVPSWRDEVCHVSPLKRVAKRISVRRILCPVRELQSLRRRSRRRRRAGEVCRAHPSARLLSTSPSSSTRASSSSSAAGGKARAVGVYARLPGRWSARLTAESVSDTLITPPRVLLLLLSVGELERV